MIIVEHTIEVYNGQIYGIKVSEYGLEKGYLDYKALSEIVGDSIRNNTIRDRTLNDWRIVNGEYSTMIMMDLIISENGYRMLKEYTDELVFYNENLDVYIWAIDHWGTSWDHVCTNTKIVERFDK